MFRHINAFFKIVCAPYIIEHIVQLLLWQGIMPSCYFITKLDAVYYNFQPVYHLVSNIFVFVCVRVEYESC